MCLLQVEILFLVQKLPALFATFPVSHCLFFSGALIFHVCLMHQYICSTLQMCCEAACTKLGAFSHPLLNCYVLSPFVYFGLMGSHVDYYT